MESLAQCRSSHHCAPPPTTPDSTCFSPTAATPLGPQPSFFTGSDPPVVYFPAVQAPSVEMLPDLPLTEEFHASKFPCLISHYPN